MRFSTKLTVFLSLTFLIVSAGLTYFIYASGIKAIEEETKDKFEEHAFHVMDAIDRMFFERYADIKVLASDPYIRSRNSTPKQITDRLIDYRDKYKMYDSLAFFNLNRIRIADTSEKNIGKQHPFTEYWPGIAEGRDFVMVPAESAAVKKIVFYFASVVKDKDGTSFGVVASRMPVEKLHDIAIQAAGIHHGEDSSRIDLVDKDGLILFSSYNPKGILKDISPDWDVAKRFLATGKKIGTEKHHFGDKEEITTFAREQGLLDFKGSDWTLIMCIPTKVAYASAIELRNRLTIMFFIVGISIIFTVFILVKNFSAPLIKLRNTANEIGRGNLDIKVDVESKDEIGELADSFNKMTADLKNSKDKLIASKEYTENIVNSTINSLIIVSPDGIIQYVNPVTCDMLGYSKEELTGKHIGIIFAAAERLPFSEIGLEDLIEKESVRNLERTYLAKDGRGIPVIFSMSVMRDKSGSIQGIVCVAQDITERKMNEQKQLELINRIEAANRELKDFAYIVSHDLKAPLRGLGSLSSWLATDYGDKLGAEGREQLDMLVGRVKRMHHLIDGILEYSRAGRIMEERTEVDLNKVVAEVIDILNPPKNIEIRVENILPIIVCEKTKIEQVFQNLISNAMKYMDKPEGVVRIGCLDSSAFGEGGEDFYTFYVSDNGPGIDEKYFDKIFQIFQTLQPRDKVESTGVGLAIAKKIIEGCGGRIWVESKVGEGTTFRFTIPKK